MAYLFDEQYYVTAKMAHMDSIGLSMTEYTLRNAIRDAGLTVQEHYETYGRGEGLNPNPYFNEYEYLRAKADQLNSTGEVANPAGGPWDADAVLKAITDAGMIPAEHYERYGAFETDADGNFLNPSNALYANAYWSAKLCELQTNYPNDGWTLESMLEAFQEIGVSPISHYMLWGADESRESGIAFVQTVPQSVRVPNDPDRDAITGHIVPGNYMNPTPPPSDDDAAAAGYPCDVGGLADPTISPPPLYPESSLPVPGDRDYIPLPPTIKPGPGILVIPPSALESSVDGNWLVVDTATGAAVLVGRDGAILGQGVADVTMDGNGILTITLPGDLDTSVSALPLVDPDTLPSCVVPDPDLANRFPPSDPDPGPVPETGGIWASGDGAGLTVEGTIRSTGSSSLTLAADGSIETWTGIKNGAVPPATGVVLDGALDASQVTGPGTLTLDTTKLAHAHAVIGSATSNNTVRLGNAKGYTGGSGKDAVTMDGATVTGAIDLGEGDNTFTMTGGTVVDRSGSSPIVGGTGKDVVTIGGDATVDGDINLDDGNDEVTIGGNAMVGDIDLGDGDNTVTMTGGTVGSFGSSDIVGGTGKDAVTISGGRVGGAIDLGDGDNTFSMTGGGIGLGYRALFGGSGKDVVSIGDDAIVTGSIDLGGGNDELTIGGNATVGDIDLGEGDNAFTMTGGMIRFGDTAVTGGAGKDEVTIRGGAVTGVIDLGDGDNTFTMTGGTLATHPDFSITHTVIEGGTGKDAVTIGGNATVDGVIALGDGDNAFSMTGGTVTGVADSVSSVVTAFLGGTGKDAVTIGGGAVTGLIELGEGDNTFTMTGGTVAVAGEYFEGITGGTGKDAVTISGNARVRGSISHGYGDDELTIDGNATVTSFIDLDDGDDRVTIGGNATVNGGIRLGSGDNFLTMTGGTVNSGGANAITGGGGSDTVIIGGGTLSGRMIELGGGNDSLTFKGNSVLKGAIDLGIGDDTFTMTGGTLDNDINDVFSGGRGNNAVTISGGAVNGIFHLGLGDNTFTMTGGTMDNRGGGLALAGGNGNDAVTISGGAVTGVINLHNGDNTFTMTGGTVTGVVIPNTRELPTAFWGGAGRDAVTISGNAAVTGVINLGDGDNTVTLTGCTVTGIADPRTGAVTALLGGTGKDTVTIGGNAAVTGDITLGSGADSLSLGAGVSVDVTQRMGDTGLYTGARVNENTASTAGLDVFTLFGGSSITIKGLNSNLSRSDTLSDRMINGLTVSVPGSYNKDANTFEVNANGSDCLLTYDADSTGGVQHESVVLVGVESKVSVGISDGDLIISAPAPSP